MLLVASYVFYGWWDYRFLALILFSTVVDYACGLAIASTRQKRRVYLLFSVLVNLCALGFFKYFNFFIDSGAEALKLFGLNVDLPVLHIILPVGISFYTFQSMSYTIDIYRGRLRPTRSFTDFALFVVFFPQLVAGPVERAVHLLPQIQNPRSFSAREINNGVWLILLGYVKKLVIADRLALLVEAGFSEQSISLSGGQAWLCLYAFAFQIYCDFSAYSDIARGAAKLLGFDLMINFRAPYLARDPSAFWRNWHISLSTWLRDYLYIPLGGNQGSRPRTYRNLLLTMLLGGLWHGAGWAYVIWGLFHGVLLSVHRFYREWRRAKPVHSVIAIAQRLLLFHLICLGWLFFRAGSVPPEINKGSFISGYLVRLTDVTSLEGTASWLVAVGLLGGLAMIAQWKHDAMERFSDWRTSTQALSVAGALVLITAFGVFDGSQFIYFQF